MPDTKQKLLDIHIKWLSKAKTAIIDGEEMTVLPYGYLQEACKEAIDKTREETIREVEGILEEITPAYIGVLESNNNRRYYEQGFGEYKEEIKQSLKSLINK